MRYVSNMEKIRRNGFNKNDEKAVFPPGSVIPEKIKNEAVIMPPDNLMNREETEPKSKMFHGFMDYDGMEFPLAAQRTLKKTDNFIKNGNNITMCNKNMLNEYICKNLGEYVEVEFLFGADTYVKKTGMLSGAGNNYIELYNPELNKKTICNISDIKFLSIQEQ